MTDDEKPTTPDPEADTTVAPETVTGGARRLLRSRDDRVIAGVAGGLGRYFDIDPVIVRIAFAVTILFGGLGIVAYLAAAIFVPSDDGTGRAAPSSRARSAGRIIGVGLLVLAGLWGFGMLTAGAAFVTGIGYGWAVVALIVVIGVALVALSFRGGARWLLVPALALAIGGGAAAAADLDLEGGVGQREYRPVSAAAIPADGYELGVGQMTVDLRDIDWSPERVVHLSVDVGVGQAEVAVPSDVCVVAEAHAGAGNLEIAGHVADGLDVDTESGTGARGTPQLVLEADIDAGEILVVNDDDFDVGRDSRSFDRFGDGYGGDSRRPPSELLRDANSEACAG